MSSEIRTPVRWAVASPTKPATTRSNTEPAGFHHRHDPPGFVAVASEPATFEAVAELVHRS